MAVGRRHADAAAAAAAVAVAVTTLWLDASDSVGVDGEYVDSGSDGDAELSENDVFSAAFMLPDEDCNCAANSRGNTRFRGLILRSYSHQ